MASPPAEESKTKPPGRVAFTMLVPVQKDQKQYLCGLCGRGFNLEANLISHIEQHTRPFQCGYCDHSFDTQSELAEHVDDHDLFVCVKLDKSAAEAAGCVVLAPAGKQSSSDHEVLSPNGRNSSSDREGLKTTGKKSSSDREGLKATGRRDGVKVRSNRSEETPDASEPVPEAAEAQSNVVPVKKTHVCKTCGETFKKMVVYVKHCLEEHGEDRPFHCTQCPLRFKMSNHLKDHLNSVHTQGKPFSCPLCQDDFKLERYLAFHIRRVHGIDDPFPVIGRRKRWRRRDGRDAENKTSPISPPVRRSRGAAGSYQKTGDRQQREGEEDSDAAAGEVDDYESDAGGPHSPTQQTGKAASGSRSPGVSAVKKTHGRKRGSVTKDGTIGESDSDQGEQQYGAGDQDNATAVRDPAKFKPKRARRRRQDQQSEVEGFLCGDCGTIFSSAVKLRNHYTNAHNTCDCGERFDDPCQMDHHKKSVHGLKGKYRPFVCALCGNRFQDAQCLRKHVFRLHKDSLQGNSAIGEDVNAILEGMAASPSLARPFQCGYCQNVFPNVGDLRDHWEYSHNACDCGEKFEEPSEMEGHKQSAHGQTEYRPLVCGLCGNRFRDARCVRQHVSIVHRKKQQSSQNTAEGPDQMEDLQPPQSDLNTGGNAVLGDFNAATVIEDMMDDGLASSVSLAKSYECGHCHNLFPTVIKLRNHWQYTHNTCDCGEQFEEPCEMESHKKSVHGQMVPYRPLLCSVCGNRFGVYRYLRQHVYRLHKQSRKSSLSTRKTAKAPKRSGGSVNKSQTAPKYRRNTEVIETDGMRNGEQVTASTVFEEIMAGGLTSNISLSKPYECGLCQTFFPNVVELRDHWHYAHSTCICEERFQDPCEMANHKKSVHGQKGKYTPYVCTQCGNSFQEHRSLRQHVYKLHRKGPESSETAQRLEMGGRAENLPAAPHLTLNPGGNVVIGEEVTAATVIEDMMTNGLAPNVVVVKPYKCGLCHHLFPNVMKLRDHWQSMHSKCVCGEILEEACDMYSHQKAIHGEGNDKRNYRPYVCALCGAGFRVYRYVRIHFDRQHNKKGLPRKKYPRPRKLRAFAGNYRCPTCQQTFPYCAWFARHCLTAHGIERPFCCLHCPAKFKIRGHLIDHTNCKHSPSALHNCPLCARQFKARKQLVAHLLRSKAHPQEQVALFYRSRKKKKPKPFA